MKFAITKSVALSTVSTLIMAGCGGGNDINARGSLQEPPQSVTLLSAAQIDAGSASNGLQALSGKAKCDVEVIALNYSTVGPKLENTNSSGVMLVPSGPCAGSQMPLIAYARGTDVLKTRTLANPSDPESFLLVAMYAAQGYAVVATDYLGYAKSTFPYHPYLHTQSEADTIIDSIRAARKVATLKGVSLSDKVMLTGYSQGGQAAFATQRAIEQNNSTEFNIVASAPSAGAYNLSGAIKFPQAIAGYQFFVPLLVNSFEKIYGNVYTNVSEVYKAPYASYIESLLPDPTLTYTTLITTGKLPGGTPSEARAALFQATFLSDMAANSNNGLYLDAQKNDLIDWSPKARTQLCGGVGDPTVLTAIHRDFAKASFTTKGLTNVTSVDVDAQIQATFGPGGKAPTDPTTAAFATYYGNYHGTYEPPFCLAAARTLFDQVK